MIDGLNLGGLLGTAGWGGLIAVAVWLVFSGRLIPRSTVDKVLTQAGEEAARWRAAYENSEAARVLDRQTAMKALESTQTTAGVVKALTEVIAPAKVGE